MTDFYPRPPRGGRLQCNMCKGHMHAALDYVAEVKHKQRDFVAKRGIRAIIN